MHSEQLQLFRNELKKKGYRLTRPRQVILSYLIKGKGHHSITAIYGGIRRMHPGIGMATVYRTVDLLLELGILRVLILKNSQPCFEINWPGDHHHHLVCRDCGVIVEFGSCNFTLIVGEIEKVTGFRVEEHTLEAYGLCPRCAAQSSSSSYSTEKM